VLGVAVFASNRNRGRLKACKGCRRRFRPLDCGCVIGSGAKSFAEPFADADPQPFANSDTEPFADAGSDIHQFRFIGR
jgi:hypothetical protein